MKFDYPLGATPLDPDEIAGLIPPHLRTQDELNEWEEANILKAHLWLNQKKPPFSLDMHFCKKLHLHMFDETWTWAGKFRQSDKNIGIDWRHISVILHNLLRDIEAQITYQSLKLDEIAARFHHRLALIHAFPNGNGRHARLMTDLFLKTHKARTFSWGSINLSNMSHTRKTYI